MPEPVSVEAVRQRAERAHAWAKELDALHSSQSPLLMHFERDMPALLAEVAQLREQVMLLGRELQGADAAIKDVLAANHAAKVEADRLHPLRDAAAAWVGAKRAIARAATGEGERLLAALDTAEDALEQATLAALDGQPDQPGGSPS